ncbi:DUF1501 domain-containing protein [Paludisphaera mucosa]|uniref:DUF1501 domain-containing protein n=1 Tax=Paludisphaera mucosa TaxID=3030827 RepID=A0ABT6FGW7_9BACT|nr:DUF1501 domain-containing protein [Paludisphaera mucosa]MDG3006810.1 DUF1501 domain-containing protein [Paludisphaera mucosa]
MRTESNIVQVAMNRHGVAGRRGFLRAVGLGAAGLAAGGVAPLGLTDLLTLRADELRKRQTACILLWMAGGPSQLETFDPKPEAANGGGTKAIETAAPGISIAQGWEKTAGVMKDVALIRSMTNKEGNHQRADYQLHTGYTPTATLKHPNIGSIAAAELGDSGFDLPHMVAIGGPTAGAGFLGASYEPFVVPNVQKPPDNAQARVPVDRFQRRLGLLNRLEKAGFEQAGGADRVRDHRALYSQTSKMVLSPRMKAFDLDQEAAPIRDAYGRTPFGQGCLLARRLVEAGVTFVEVRCGGWDTHTENNQRVAALAGQVDPAFATLINDLKSRGMLDRTLVVWMGEFGRTPKVNPNAGRDHFPRVFNVALAGGGVKGGQVIGGSSGDGTEVKDRPVTVPDLMSSICRSLGVDAAKENQTSIGRPMKIVDGGKAVGELFG